MVNAAIDYSIFEGKLIHPLDAFRPEVVKARADALGSIAYARFETFAWLLEIVAQLTAQVGSQFVLRGGTNVQLRLEDSRQRGSQDVDGMFRGSVADLEAACASINERFADCAGFLQFERLQRDHPPRDFCAWSCSVPAAHGGRSHDGLPRRLLTIEISLQHDPLPVEQLAGEVFGFRLEGETWALTRGAIVGDKLLTLGPHTTGIQDDDVDRIARQFYDLDNLTLTGMDEQLLSNAAETAAVLAPIEGEYRDLRDVDASTALRDAEQRAFEWGQIGLGTAVERSTFNEIRSWQGNNVASVHHLGAPGWALRALRVGLLARAVRETIELSAGSALRSFVRRSEIASNADAFRERIVEMLVEHSSLGKAANALKAGESARPALLLLHTLPDEAVDELMT